MDIINIGEYVITVTSTKLKVAINKYNCFKIKICYVKKDKTFPDKEYTFELNGDNSVWHIFNNVEKDDKIIIYINKTDYKSKQKKALSCVEKVWIEYLLTNGITARDEIKIK
jgi:hypothetical protein